MQRTQSKGGGGVWQCFSHISIYLSGAGLELPQAVKAVLMQGCMPADTSARGWMWSAEGSVLVYLQQAT